MEGSLEGSRGDRYLVPATRRTKITPTALHHYQGHNCLWDSLGYIRVRSLRNPKWRRDSRWLVQMTAQRPSAPSAELALYDRAIAAARSYPRTSSGQESPDEAWDEVLAAIDELLVLRQERHLAAVRAAGCSS